MKTCIRMLPVAAAIVLFFPGGVNALDLDNYQWQNRLLLLFAPAEENAAYIAAAEEIAANSAQVVDRDLVVIHVVENGLSPAEGRPLSRSESQRLRDRFSIRPGRFTAVLIGKDGGVKRVQKDALDLQEIFDRIDAMPMRQREMREKRSPS